MSLSKLREIFRPKYRELKQNEKEQIDRIKSKAADLAAEFYPTDTREKSIALTKLEEAVMWAVKGITL